MSIVIVVRWSSGRPADLLFPSAGSLMDWLCGTRRALTFQILLRDKGEAGFILLRSRIQPSIDEAYEGAKALLAAM
ncbi:M14 family zinc carboxypeptidase [Nocardia brasiliensis]|uniref:M14 family zinc carboxypeptidase n=1 Tax=Nocardia brasiliensis TaxID=37326 RepID=UPI0004A6C25A|nr:M14 family zinc carboxypeptidase [Nocardia brasiliensis]